MLILWREWRQWTGYFLPNAPGTWYVLSCYPNHIVDDKCSHILCVTVSYRSFHSKEDNSQGVLSLRARVCAGNRGLIHPNCLTSHPKP
jgi:hypothetical protein